MYQISGRRLVTGNVTVQCTAEEDIQRLHTATDAQHGAAALYKGLYQKMFRTVKAVIDVTAAGQQQCSAIKRAVEITAEQHVSAGMADSGEIIDILTACPIDINRFYSVNAPFPF